MKNILRVCLGILFLVPSLSHGEVKVPNPKFGEEGYEFGTSEYKKNFMKFAFKRGFGHCTYPKGDCDTSKICDPQNTKKSGIKKKIKLIDWCRDKCGHKIDINKVHEKYCVIKENKAPERKSTVSIPNSEQPIQRVHKDEGKQDIEVKKFTKGRSKSVGGKVNVLDKSLQRPKKKLSHPLEETMSDEVLGMEEKVQEVKELPEPKEDMPISKEVPQENQGEVEGFIPPPPSGFSPPPPPSGFPPSLGGKKSPGGWRKVTTNADEIKKLEDWMNKDNKRIEEDMKEQVLSKKAAQPHLLLISKVAQEVERLKSLPEDEPYAMTNIGKIVELKVEMETKEGLQRRDIQTQIDKLNKEDPTALFEKAKPKPVHNVGSQGGSKSSTGEGGSIAGASVATANLAKEKLERRKKELALVRAELADEQGIDEEEVTEGEVLERLAQKQKKALAKPKSVDEEGGSPFKLGGAKGGFKKAPPRDSGKELASAKMRLKNIRTDMNTLENLVREETEKMEEAKDRKKGNWEQQVRIAESNIIDHNKKIKDLKGREVKMIESIRQLEKKIETEKNKKEDLQVGQEY